MISLFNTFVIDRDVTLLSIPKKLRNPRVKMFFLNVIVVLYFIFHVFPTSIITDERLVSMDNFQSNTNNTSNTSIVNRSIQFSDEELQNHHNQVLFVRFYLIFGYIILLFIIVTVCKSAKNKETNYSTILCSEWL